MVTALYKHDLWAFSVAVYWKHVNKACFIFALSKPTLLLERKFCLLFFACTQGHLFVQVL